MLIKLLEAPVKPEHPIDFIRDNLGPTLAEKHRIENLEQQLTEYKQEVSDLKAQIDQLKSKLSESEQSSDSNDATVIVADTTKADDEVKGDEVKPPAELVKSVELVNGKCGGEAEIPAEQKIAESEKAATPVEAKEVIVETSDAEKADIAESNSAEPTSKQPDEEITKTDAAAASVENEKNEKETTTAAEDAVKTADTDNTAPKEDKK